MDTSGRSRNNVMNLPLFERVLRVAAILGATTAASASGASIASFIESGTSLQNAANTYEEADSLSMRQRYSDGAQALTKAQRLEDQGMNDLLEGAVYASGVLVGGVVYFGASAQQVRRRNRRLGSQE